MPMTEHGYLIWAQSHLVDLCGLFIQKSDLSGLIKSSCHVFLGLVPLILNPHRWSVGQIQPGGPCQDGVWFDDLMQNHCYIPSMGFSMMRKAAHIREVFPICMIKWAGLLGQAGKKRCQELHTMVYGWRVSPVGSRVSEFKTNIV